MVLLMRVAGLHEAEGVRAGDDIRWVHVVCCKGDTDLVTDLHDKPDQAAKYFRPQSRYYLCTRSHRERVRAYHMMLWGLCMYYNASWILWVYEELGPSLGVKYSILDLEARAIL